LRAGALHRDRPLVRPAVRRSHALTRGGTHAAAQSAVARIEEPTREKRTTGSRETFFRRGRRAV